MKSSLAILSFAFLFSWNTFAGGKSSGIRTEVQAIEYELTLARVDIGKGEYVLESASRSVTITVRGFGDFEAIQESFSALDWTDANSFEATQAGKAKISLAGLKAEIFWEGDLPGFHFDRDREIYRLIANPNKTLWKITGKRTIGFESSYRMEVETGDGISKIAQKELGSALERIRQKLITQGITLGKSEDESIESVKTLTLEERGTSMILRFGLHGYGQSFQALPRAVQ